MSFNIRDRKESLNDFEDNRQQKQTSNESNLYNKYKDNVVNHRLQRSAEGIPAISVEDFQILRDCNKESFWKRCLPMSCGVCALMFYLAHQKKTTPKVWHYLSGTFIGWFVGKLTYRRVCEKRLINSDSNSPFVTAMRRRKGIVREDIESDNMMAVDSHTEPNDPYWGQQSKDPFGYGSHEFADYKDDEQHRDDTNDQFSPAVTYEDLRAKNRSTLKSNNRLPFSS